MKESQLFKDVTSGKIPKHIAIIVDGNGRWAKKRGKPRTFGHGEGMKTVDKIVEFASGLGVEVLSLFAFSTENWKRPVTEVDHIFGLLVYYLDNMTSKMIKNNIVFRVIGDTSAFSNKIQQRIADSMEKTAHNTGMILNVALNYGARDEVVQAIKRIFQEKSESLIENLTYEDLSRYLYTANLPDVDLMIRPSGELRLSNFLLLQSAYAELWFSDILWPDFSEEDLLRAIGSYQKRDRRFGAIHE